MSRKLAGLGFSFALAVLAAALLPPPGIFLAAAVCVVLAAVLRTRPAVWVFLGAVAGFLWFLLFSVVAVEPVQALAGKTYTVTALAETDCVYNYTGEQLRGTVLVEELDGRRVHFKVYCGNIPVRQVGERFTAQLTFSPLEQDRYRLSSMAKGQFLQAEAARGQRIDRSTALRFRLLDLRTELSQRLRLWLPKRLGGMAAAMVLGDRSALDDRDTDAFRGAGVAHLLAVSGLHIGLLCGLLTDKRRRFYRPAILAQAGVLVGYMLLTGCGVSVRRAGIVFLFALAGDFLLQPYDPLTATGAAALLFCIVNPYAPCDVSFQLSFSAVLGIQIGLGHPVKAGKAPWYQEMAEKLADTLRISVLAALATLPVLVANQMTVSGAGILCNLLVVWMLPGVLVLGVVVLLLSPVSFAAHAASLCLGVWLQWMMRLVHWCASLPFARLNLPRGYTLTVLALLVMAAWLWLLFVKNQALRKALVPVLALLAAAAVFAGVHLQRDVVRVELVGRAGTPCAVITQNGQAIVVFRGGAANLNQVDQALQEQGEPELTLLVDLRENPKELDFPQVPRLTLENETAYGKQTVLTDLTLEWYNTGSANLLVLETEGGTIGFMAGNIRLKEPVAVDVFCAAGALSDSVQCGAILCTSKNPSWLAAAGTTPVCYGSNPVLVLRRGKNIVYEEVTALAVQ